MRGKLIVRLSTLLGIIFILFLSTSLKAQVITSDYSIMNSELNAVSAVAYVETEKTSNGISYVLRVAIIVENGSLKVITKEIKRVDAKKGYLANPSVKMHKNGVYVAYSEWIPLKNKEVLKFAKLQYVSPDIVNYDNIGIESINISDIHTDTIVLNDVQIPVIVTSIETKNQIDVAINIGENWVTKTIFDGKSVGKLLSSQPFDMIPEGSILKIIFKLCDQKEVWCDSRKDGDVYSYILDLAQPDLFLQFENVSNPTSKNKPNLYFQPRINDRILTYYSYPSIYYRYADSNFKWNNIKVAFKYPSYFNYDSNGIGSVNNITYEDEEGLKTKTYIMDTLAFENLIDKKVNKGDHYFDITANKMQKGEDRNLFLFSIVTTKSDGSNGNNQLVYYRINAANKVIQSLVLDNSGFAPFVYDFDID